MEAENCQTDSSLLFCFMDKRKIIPLLVRAAQAYQETLLDKDYLYLSAGGMFFQASFRSEHFPHLAGVELPGHKRRDGSIIPFAYQGQGKMNKRLFFYRCATGKIRVNDFVVSTAQAIWIEPKLKTLHTLGLCLPQVMGCYDDSFSFRLQADYVCGVSVSCLLFKKNPNSSIPYYQPCSTQARDIRQLCAKLEKIILIVSKDKQSDLYDNINCQRDSDNVRAKASCVRELLADKVLEQLATKQQG